jgi:hypothetical protein
MLSLNYESGRYISFVDGLFYSSAIEIPPGSLIEINGYKIRKPNRFKNKAHERAFEIALVLAKKKSMWSGITLITTPECIDIIMFNGDPEIQLKLDAKKPEKVAKDAMRYVPNFFESGIVVMDHRKHGKKICYLEINRE